METAKQTGRAAFGEMVAYLKAHPSVRVMLVEKTDRLYRNLKDWVTVDELDVEIHFPKEGVVLSRESRSSEKFMHGIKVLMAKNYIDNLSEEARKGMQEKAEQGIWPTKAPLGYRNVTGPDGKKIIATDPDVAPIDRQAVRMVRDAATYSLKEAARKARAAGLVYPQERRQGAGEHGPHDPAQPALHRLVRMERQADPGPARAAGLGRAVGAGAGRARRPLRQEGQARQARFRLLGSDRLRQCGCAVVGEIKKQRYVYYHCTGYADKCQGNPASCRRKYVREEVLEAQFTELLGRLQFDDEVLEWVREALHASHADERREHEEAIKRLQAEYKRLERPHQRHVCRQARRAGGRAPSSTRCRASGARSRTAACARSNGTRAPTSPTWTRACSFSNSRGTPKGCSNSRNRAKNAAC